MDFISIKNECKEFIYYFCNWWADNNKDTDLVEIILHDGPEINMYGRIKKCNLILGREYFPVATEGQLRQFIEDKTGCIINISYKHKPQDGHMKLEFDFYEYPSKDKYMIYISTKDIIATSILEAWWKVALEIAKEKVKE